jgi:hypothetical protein
MINTSSVEKATYRFRMLDDDQINEIVFATFDIMRTVGFKILHEGARNMLKQAGARVEDEVVKIPEHIVRGCLALAPKGWTIYDRNGMRSMEVIGRKNLVGGSFISYPLPTERLISARQAAPRSATEHSFKRLLSLCKIMQEYQSLLSEPFEVQYKSNLSALHRLPLVHLDPDPMRLVWLKPGSYHHPLKLPRILPFLQLHRSETAAYSTVKIPEKHVEFLDSEIRDPAPQVHIQLFNGLVH